VICSISHGICCIDFFHLSLSYTEDEEGRKRCRKKSGVGSSSTSTVQDTVEEVNEILLPWQFYVE